MSVGSAPPQGKAGNEDALFLSPPHGRAPGMVAVADAHFGARASELALRAIEAAAARTCWDDASELGHRRVLSELVRAAGSRVLREAEGSETTLLLVTILGTRLVWTSIGDSYLYLLPATTRPRVLNPIARQWLGARANIDAATLASFGTVDLSPGDRILLATDGIPEAVRGRSTFTPDDVQAALDAGGDGPLEFLVGAALARGGEDNVAAILLSRDPSCDPGDPPERRTP